MKRMLKRCLPVLLLLSSLRMAAQSFTNPILSGFYPDPSICKAGDDYYLINSTFAFYPGLPVFHSKDLLNWQLVSYVLNRPEQLPLEGTHVSGGLFAPAITYHKGMFYVVCTNVNGVGNFVVTTTDPKGPWSNPVKLPEVNGIDPSIFFDEDDKAYIVFNSIPPENISKHDGHRTIRIYGFDAANMKITGEEKIIVNGGTDMAKKPVWIEGPHLIKKDGWYYLICAEGGTGYNHSEVVFRSKDVYGPYVSYEKNPILTQRHLDKSRVNPITTTGHADFVQDNKGNWWAVFLGCRPYEGDYYNTGRETFMAPVKWENGWPQVELGGEEVKYQYPIQATLNKNREAFNGNLYFKDEFDAASLNLRYAFLRVPKDNWYSVTEKPGALSIRLKPETISGRSNPSFIGFRQSHLGGFVAVSMDFTAAAENEQAGLLLFQNENHYYWLCKTIRNNKPVLLLLKGPGNKNRDKNAEEIAMQELPAQAKGSLLLKIEAKGSQYAFWYALKKNKWKLLKDGVDGKFVSTKDAGGFVGCMYAMYASSNGKASENKALFNWFENRNADKVYKK